MGSPWFLFVFSPPADVWSAFPASDDDTPGRPGAIFGVRQFWAGSGRRPGRRTHRRHGRQYALRGLRPCRRRRWSHGWKRLCLHRAF